MSQPPDRIQITRPYLDGAEAAAAASALASGFVVQGPQVAEFERLVREVTGSTTALAVSSATTGLHLALVTLGIGPGDEVLVADFTFPATANVVVHLGATPVLIDVHTDTYAMDVEDLRRKITPKSRAILPIDPFGLPYDADAINAVASEHGLAVVEDAACAIGGSYKGRAAGTLGTIGVFSFHGRKVITTGEGGMCITDDAALGERLALMRSHGGERDGFKLRFVDAGFNYRMSDIAGAIGVVQMGKLSEIVSKRRALAAELRGLLDGIEGITVQAEPEGCVHTYQSFVTLLAGGIDRDRVVDDLKARGIESTIGTYALHTEPYFRERFGYATGDLSGSARLGAQTLTLPLYPNMPPDAPERIATAVREILGVQ